MEESLVIRVSILELYVLNPFNNRNITLSSRWWILLSLFLWQPSSELCVPFFCSIVDLWKKTDNRRTSLSLLSALALDFASWHLSDWVRFNRHEVCIVPRSFCTFESSHCRAAPTARPFQLWFAYCRITATSVPRYVRQAIRNWSLVCMFPSPLNWGAFVHCGLRICQQIRPVVEYP